MPHELARHFSAAHVCLDSARALYPVSATAIRADLAGHWHLLPSSVRAGLTARVVVLGAESTGTTTLTLDLRQALRARGGAWATTHNVPEYGREYSANLVALARARGNALPPSELDWQEADFIDIAHEQTRREDLCARSGILTDPAGVPFDDDGLRDGEAHRSWMTERFRQLLDAPSVSWLLVQGSRAERCAQALDAIDTVLKDPFRWTRA